LERGEKLKVNFTFVLPEEQTEYDIYRKASDYHCAWTALANVIRDKRKYAEAAPTDWQEVSDLIWETMNEYGVDPYEN
jgi:hypothetical protein